MLLKIRTKYRWLAPLIDIFRTPEIPLPPRDLDGENKYWYMCPCRKTNTDRPAHNLKRFQLLSFKNFHFWAF